jgi:hypothetical protein
MTNHGVQALFDATRIGMTEIISAVRAAFLVPANMPREKAAPLVLCRQGSCALPIRQQPAIHASFIAKLLTVSDDQESSMKLPFAAVAASLVCLIIAPVFAQTTPPAPQTTTVPVPATKRVTCLATTQNLKGQDKRDQMQLCMAQARLDCLKQAIDQKIVGEPRKSFIKTCVGTDGAEQQ